MPVRVPSALPRLDGESAADHTARVQRERLLDGVVHAVARHGFPKATIADIVSPVGLGRNTFYLHFDDKERCFLASGDRWFARLDEAIDASCHADASDRGERVGRSVAAILGAVAADADASRAWLVCALGAGRRARERRDAGLERLAGRLSAVSTAADTPPTAALGITGAVGTMLCAEIGERGPAALERLQGDVAWLVTLAVG